MEVAGLEGLGMGVDISIGAGETSLTGDPEGREGE